MGNGTPLNGKLNNMSTTREEHIQAIRAACIKVNPRNLSGLTESEKVWEDAVRAIRLADVLLAKATRDEHGQQTLEELAFECHRVCLSWNLRTDDLTAQSDECIAFIHSLICV